MAEIKALLDKYGVIYQAQKMLPSDQLKLALIEALAELENNECHRTRSFPKTRLHRIRGYEQAIYRADIDKTSGWRLHLQYAEGELHLKDIVEGNRHDDVLEVVRSKKHRYE
jgi:hypothetical protein